MGPRTRVIAASAIAAGLNCAYLEERQSIDLPVLKAVEKGLQRGKPSLFGGDVLSSTKSGPNAVGEIPNFATTAS